MVTVHTHLYWSPTHTVNGCDLSPLTRTQKSEQEHSDFAVSNKRRQHWTPTTLSKAFPLEQSRLFTRCWQNTCRHLWNISKISRKFVGE